MLKMRLKNKPYCNDLHLFLFAVVLLLLSIYQPFFYIALVVYLIFIIKKTKYILPISILLFCVYTSYKLSDFRLHELESKDYEGVYEVVEVQDKEIIIKGDTKIIIFSSIERLAPGDKISAKIRVYRLEEASYEGDFNAKKYYRCKGITNRGRILKYEIIGSRWTIARLRYSMLNYYEVRLNEKSFAYLKTLFFGISDLDKEVKSAYSILYISHLLAISGLHITFLYSFLIYFYRKCFRIKGEKIALFTLGIYVLFIGYPSSCLRAFLFLALELWNKQGQIKYTKLDILSISFIGMVLIFPLKAFQTSFILSFIISFIWIFMKEYTHDKRKIEEAFLSSIICIFSILPFLINQTNQISLVGILLSFILGYLFGKFIFPFVLLMLIFPCSIYENVFKLLDLGLIWITDYTFPISMPNISIFWCIIYYLLFIYILVCLVKKVKKYTLFYVPIFIGIILSLRISNPFYKVTFIDVGQGDSIFIELPHNQGNVLVDSYNGTAEYLTSIGVKRLDCVVLSHFDQDHMGTIDQVINKFKVGRLVYSTYENENKIKSLDVDKQRVKSGNSFRVNEVTFQILGPIQNLFNSNANSVVLKFNLGGYEFLLTGDMTEEEEKDLILKYGTYLDSDILKVAHHGSSTSSTSDFLNLVSPTFSIISVAEDNSYGLPNLEIVERLRRCSNVYMTKDSGNIQIIIRNHIQIKGYRK
ncbi:MAG: DNA internalization-related competence protein ComEC/Rec2 [Anaeroplasmataceae bacterium]|nr:DNA internalization-related competence protein ComEC/Rec2 [Anaeroplasmataceae bacterium]